MSLLASVTLACFAALELGLLVRDALHGKGGRDRDRGSRPLLALSLGAAIGIAVATASTAPPVALEAVGVAVMWLGLAVRVSAVAALGAAFRTTVEVEPGQVVVSSGPYRWIRHPSYLGLLLVVVGFGLAAGSAPAVVACLVLPLPALVRRIQLEEAELSRVLGDRYRTYQARTARLVPGLW